MKRIIFRPIQKKNLLKGVRSLEKKGFKNVQVTDARGIIPKRKIGAVLIAFRGKKKVPKGFKTKIEEF